MHDEPSPPAGDPPAAGPAPAEQNAAAVLHDLNNILATIVMHADLLLDEIDAEAPASEHVAAIVAAVDRGSALVRHALPRTEKAADDAEPRDTGNGTVLIADDNAATRKAIVSVLTGAGYGIVEAATGNEAIRLIGERPDGFDLVVTDIAMPEGTGADVAAFVWEQRPATPLVFITGNVRHPLLVDRDLMTLRGWQILRKPFHARTLLALVRDTLGESAAQQAGGRAAAG